MHKRFLPVAILTGILFIAALAGYLIPARSEGAPVRVLLENKGGKVIFTHQSHAESQEQDCAACHHTSGNAQNPPKCASCHVKKFDETFIADHQESMDEQQCASCHHPEATIEKFSHEKHADDYAEDDCQACHHDTSIEPEPQACSNCHEKEDNDTKLSLKKASHTKCADCHEEMYQEGIKGCRNCHTRKQAKKDDPDLQACSSCHSEPADQLLPTTTVAFHTQCMTCHEKQAQGPFGDDACYQCHMR